MKAPLLNLRILPVFVLFVVACIGSSAQLGLNVVVDSVHCTTCADPTCGATDLDGFITYQVYAQIPQGGCLTGVFGDLNDITPNTMDATSLEITFDGLVFNHWLPAGAFGTNNLCGLPGFDCAVFDSYLSMCQDCSSDGGNIFSLSTAPDGADPFSIFINSLGCAGLFESGDLILDQGGWFAPPGTIPCATSGADEQILIAQFTTDGGFCMHFFVAYQPGCTIGADIVTYEVDTCIVNPCTANPFDLSLIADAPLCFGGEPVIELDNTGNGTVEYQLHDGDNGVLPNNPTLDTYFSNNGISLNDLTAGCYYFTMIDSVGCRDTTSIDCFTDPIELVYNATLLTDNECFGDELGSIATQCSGGTGQVMVTLNGPGTTYDDEQPCGTTFTGLGCVSGDGTYVVTAEDGNGCSLSETIELYCAEELILTITADNIECFGECNGALTGNLAGGTDPVNASWLFNGNAFQSYNNVNTTVNVTINSLCAGDYDFSVQDANGCPLADSFEITQPDSIELDITITDLSCFGVCVGEIEIDVTGGTGSPDITCEDVDTGQIVNGPTLCAVDYICTIVDDNNCSVDTLLTVNTPDEITFEITSSDVSCFGLCDGEIHLANVTGGFPPYDFVIAPNSPGIEGVDFVDYVGLCADEYDIQVVDNVDCGVTTGDIEIIEPDELAIDTVVTQITCFGYDNGTVEIDYTGGTGDVYLTVDPPGLLELDSLLMPGVLDSLPPGLLTITLTDSTQCFSQMDILINEPPALLLDITETVNVGCGGACDGAVAFTVQGGIEPYSYYILPEPGLPQAPLPGPSPFLFDDMCAGLDTLIVLDVNGCPDTSSFEILEPPPIYVAEGSNWVTCTGMCDGFVSLDLSGGTGELTITFDPEQPCMTYIPADTAYVLCDLCEGVYYYEIFDEAGCSYADSVLTGAVIVTDMILTTFTSPETCWNEMDGTATIAVQNGTPPITYLWDDSMTQTTSTAVGLESNELYTVIVVDSIGCTLSAQAFIEPTIGCFFISTALTPNGDGVNDEWLLGGLEYFPETIVQVFNRWGQLLFESRGYDAPWDGTHKGNKLPTADYYFVIDYSDTAEPITGTVTIKY